MQYELSLLDFGFNNFQYRKNIKRYCMVENRH